MIKMSSRTLLKIFLCWSVLFSGSVAFANGYDDALKHVRKAEAFLEKKDYKEALRELEEAADWNSGYGYYAYIRYLSGKIHAATGDLKIAEKHYREALKEAPQVNYRFVDPAYQIPEEEIRAFLEKSPGSAPPPPAKSKPVPEFYFLAEGKNAEVYSNIVFEFGHKHQRPCEFPGNPPLLKKVFGKEGSPIKAPVPLLEDQVKKLISPYCKNRLNFKIFAQGKGWIDEVSLDKLYLQAEPSFCGDEDRNFRILASGEKLQGAPLFFTTKKVDSRSNGFQSADSLKTDSGKFSNLKFDVPKAFKKTHQISAYSFLSKKKNQSLVLIEGKGDGGSWNGLYFVEDGKSKKLTETFESEYCGPDDLVLEGILDYDADGDFDILLRGSRSMILLDRHSLGFRAISWGLKPCTC
jgi:tetratricopeptide (TPR) repeat protein